MGDEQFRYFVLFVEQTHHQLFLDPVKGAIAHCHSRGDAQRLTCQTSLAEELTGAQNGDDRFFALLGNNLALHLASQNVEKGIRRFSLPVDDAVRGVF